MATPLAVAAAFCVVGCNGGNTPPHVTDPAHALKISMLQSGEVLADGAEVTLAELDARLAKAEKDNQALWYHREDIHAKLPPVALDVADLIVKHRIIIANNYETCLASLHVIQLFRSVSSFNC